MILANVNHLTIYLTNNIHKCKVHTAFKVIMIRSHILNALITFIQKDVKITVLTQKTYEQLRNTSINLDFDLSASVPIVVNNRLKVT